MEAITREEKIISGENLTPITRKEMFLAKAAGMNVQTPTPITREEMFLSKITGGGGSVEGTAIPVGEKVYKIYFNNALSLEETNKYLSQLTYVDIGLGIPINIIFATNTNVLAAVKISDVDEHYALVHNVALAIDGNEIFIFYGEPRDFNKPISVLGTGWNVITRFYTIVEDNNTQIPALASTFAFDYWDLETTNGEISNTDIDGLPVGAENEKIKNVLSITPFGASGGTSTNSPLAYTVSSVDELPSDAVDGSTAIVENSDSLIGEWEWHEELNLPEKINSESCVASFKFLARLKTEGEFGVLGLDVVYTAINLSSTAEIEYELPNPYADEGGDDYVWFYPYVKGSYINGWQFEGVRKITILTEPDNEDFKTIFRANADRISGGKSLYTHENGEWVYKSEVA